jgi:hypothetical protein
MKYFRGSRDFVNWLPCMLSLDPLRVFILPSRVSRLGEGTSLTHTVTSTWHDDSKSEPPTTHCDVQSTAPMRRSRHTPGISAELVGSRQIVWSALKMRIQETSYLQPGI